MQVQREIAVCWIRLTKAGHIVVERSAEFEATLPQRGARKYFSGAAHDVVGIFKTPHLESRIHILVAEQ